MRLGAHDRIGDRTFERGPRIPCPHESPLKIMDKSRPTVSSCSDSPSRRFVRESLYIVKSNIPTVWLIDPVYTSYKMCNRLTWNSSVSESGRAKHSTESRATPTAPNERARWRWSLWLRTCRTTVCKATELLPSEWLQTNSTCGNVT